MTKTTAPLLPHEIAFLKAGGALGIDSDQHSSTDNLISVEYDQMVAAALKVQEVAERLGVSIQTVLNRIEQGSLYAIDTPSGLVCPAFQFVDNATLPGLEVVLAAASKRTHPVAILRFFLASTQDLEFADRSLSPREWLMQRHSPHPVALLIEDM